MHHNPKFYLCKLCGNLLGLIENKGGAMTCCGQPVTELVPNTVEASLEKHLPVASLSGDTLTVNVGSAPHPMGEDHYIGFVFVETENGGQRKYLKIGGEPTCKFVFTGDKPTAVYAYCNLHGMWKSAL